MYDYDENIAYFRKVGHLLPLPISYVVLELSDQIEKESGCSYVFFTTEYIMRYTALILKSIYLNQVDCEDEILNVLIRRFLTRPCMNHWRTFSFKAAEALKKYKYANYISTLDNLLHLIKSKETKRIIDLRNSTTGHPGCEPDVMTIRDVFHQTLPHLTKLVEASLIFASQDLYIWSEDDRLWKKMMGPIEQDCPSLEKDMTGVIAPGCIFIEKNTPLPVFPLIVGTFLGYHPDAKQPKNPMLMFDGVDLHEKRMIYIGKYGRGFGKEWLESYQELLAKKKLPLIQSEISELTISDVRERVSQALQIKKHELYYEIDDSTEIEKTLDRDTQNQLMYFIESEASVLFLVGGAGFGKSTHAIEFGQQALNKGFITIMLRAKHEFDIAHAFKEYLRRSIEASLQIIGKVRSVFLDMSFQTDKPVLLIVDGMDELGRISDIQQYISQIGDWIGTYPKETVKVVITIRSRHHEQVFERESIQRKFEKLLYRPSNFKGYHKQTIDQCVRLHLLPKSTTKECYEQYRYAIPNHHVTSEYQYLSKNIQRSCRNPRWMMLFLRTFDQNKVQADTTIISLWTQIITKHIFKKIGKRPIFAKRAQLMLMIVTRMMEEKKLRIKWEKTFDSETELFLESAGYIAFEYDENDFFSSPSIYIPDPDLTVALILYSYTIQKIEIKSIASFLDTFSGTILYPLIESVAVEISLVLIKQNPTQNQWCDSLPTDVLALIVYRLLGIDFHQMAHDILFRIQNEKQQKIIEILWIEALEKEMVTQLYPLSKLVVQWPQSKFTSTTIYIIGNILRFNEDIDGAITWISTFQPKSSSIATTACLMLGNILRDKGRWYDAICTYTDGLKTVEPDSPDLPLILAGRGESYIWIREIDKALTDLDTAVHRISGMSSYSLERQCLIYQKYGIAWRLSRKPIKALQAFSYAREIAVSNHFSVEIGKIDLEIALVIDSLQGYDQSIAILEQTVDNFQRQSYIRGMKKSFYCLGRVYENHNKREKAKEAYSKSLDLNRKYYDTLGLKLNHQALARITYKEDQKLSDHHKKKSLSYRHKGFQIKGIIFDFDNVLYEKKINHDQIFRDKFYETLSSFTKLTVIPPPLESKIHIENVLRPLGLQFDDIIDDVYHRIEPSEYVLSSDTLFAELQHNSLPCVILSHANRKWIEKVLKHLHLHAFFPHIICKEDLLSQRKTNSYAIFQKAAQILDVPLHEIAMLDDTEENLTIPQNMGMFTYLIGKRPKDHFVPHCIHANTVDFLRSLR